MSIKRTWRAAGKNVDRNVDPRDVKDYDCHRERLGDHLSAGNAKTVHAREKGTAKIIKDHEPIVIPVVVEALGGRSIKRLLMKA